MAVVVRTMVWSDRSQSHTDGVDGVDNIIIIIIIIIIIVITNSTVRKNHECCFTVTKTRQEQ